MTETSIKEGILLTCAYYVEKSDYRPCMPPRDEACVGAWCWLYAANGFQPCSAIFCQALEIICLFVL